MTSSLLISNIDPSISEFVPEEDTAPEETAQTWLQRHLEHFLVCEDKSIDNFLSSDVTPLISFLHSNDSSRSLFITIQRLPPPPPEPILFDALPEITSDAKKSMITGRAGRNRSKMRKSRPKKKKKTKSPTKKTSKSPSKSPTKKKKGLKKKHLEKKEDIDNALEIQLPTEYALEWHLQREIPTHCQFVCVIPKTEDVAESDSLDDSYHVFEMHNTRHLKSALQVGQIIFGEDFSFEMQMDILLILNNINERKLPEEFILERFVIECVSTYFCSDVRLRTESGDGRSVGLILAQNIKEFCASQNWENKPCLQIQLSFYDIDLLIEESDLHHCASRLCCAMSQLQVLKFLYGTETLEWIRKVFIYILDLFSTILAHNITRKSNLLTNYSPESEVGPICPSFQSFVKKMKALSKDIFDSDADRSSVEKIVLSFHIVTVLEQELDLTVDKVRDLCSTKRDMTLERCTIKEAHDVLKELSHYLDENCLESAVESGNLDSLRTLAKNMVFHNKKLDRIMMSLS